MPPGTAGSEVLRSSVNSCKGTGCTDVRVTNTFQQVGDFLNMESANKENQLCTTLPVGGSMQGPQNHPQNAQKWVGLLLPHCFPKAHLHLSIYFSLSLSLFLCLSIYCSLCGMWILAPQPGVKPASFELEAESYPLDHQGSPKLAIFFLKLTVICPHPH